MSSYYNRKRTKSLLQLKVYYTAALMKWVRFRNVQNHMVKVLPGRERTSPHELVQICGEKVTGGTELAFKFSFSAHPSVLYILHVQCVISVTRIGKHAVS